jgi:hypothetical protein
MPIAQIDGVRTALPPFLAAGEGPPIWVWAALGLAAVAVGAVVLYNQLVAMTVRADTAWSDIDVQLKRRHDLIPNVVEAVKGYAGYEKGALEAVVAARARAMGAAGATDAAAAETTCSSSSPRSKTPSRPPAATTTPPSAT